MSGYRAGDARASRCPGRARSFFAGAPLDWEEEDVKAQFFQLGDISDFKLLKEGDRSRGCGIVAFARPAVAAECLWYGAGPKDAPFYLRQAPAAWLLPRALRPAGRPTRRRAARPAGRR